MANKAPEPLPLHMAELTATQFLEIWNKFDTDGNGCIEGKELEHFIRELELARKSASVDPSNASFKDRMKEFMQKFDENGDGKIEMSEFSIWYKISNMLLYFKSWQDFSSSFRLLFKAFVINDLFFCVKRVNLRWNCRLAMLGLSYLSSGFQPFGLKMFDLNGDGKLGLSEMARIFCSSFRMYIKLSPPPLFPKQDGNGYIDEHELDALLRDLYQKHKMVVVPQNLASSKKSIMALSDGGKLFRTELEIVLCKDPSV
uniref:Calbindin 2b n=1 Tax=Sinocyclocheilus grahami TaxID=75366 RepID=A0A672S7B8_SINGR